MASDIPELADTRASLVARAESRTGGALSAPAVPAPAASPAPAVAPAAPAAPVAPEPQPVAEPPESGALPTLHTPAVASEPQPQPVAPAPPPPAAAEDPLAALRAENEALKARLAASAPAPSAPPVPQPVAEPAPAPPSDQEVHTYAVARTQQVNGIQQVVAQYNQLKANVGSDDGFGGWTPGSLGVIPTFGGYAVPELDRRIETLREQLDPDKAKALGLPPIDELYRDSARAALVELEHSRRSRIDTFRDQRERADFLANRYQQVYDHFKAEATRGYTEQRERQEHEAAVDSLAVEIRGRWESEFRSVLTELQVDPKNEPLVNRLWEQVKTHGRLASNEDVEPTVLHGWLKTVVSNELGWVDNYHRMRSGEYGKGKIQDAGVAVAAPRAAAPAPSPAASTKSYEEQQQENRARLRQSFMRGRRVSA